MKIYFDGGCAPNPGQMSSCIVICPDGEKAQAHTMMDLGYGTNNVAEWSAFIWAAEWAKDNGVKKCVVLGDSMLVIKQASGLWKINHELFATLLEQFKQIAKGVEFELGHVPRNSNLAGIYLEHGSI